MNNKLIGEICKRIIEDGFLCHDSTIVRYLSKLSDSEILDIISEDK